MYLIPQPMLQPSSRATIPLAPVAAGASSGARLIALARLRNWWCRGWLLACVGLPLVARAQRVPPPAHWVPSLYLDNRNPFEDAAAVRVIGLNLGVTPPGQHYRIGIAGYTLRRSYAQFYTIYQGKGKNQKIKNSYTPELNLFYVTPSFTYTVFAHRFFEVNVPLDMGIGSSHYTLTDDKGQMVTNLHDIFIPVEAGVGLLLKPTRWVGVSGGVGYRAALGDVEFEDDFNGWYYCYRLNVFVGTIWTDLHRHRTARSLPETPSQP